MLSKMLVLVSFSSTNHFFLGFTFFGTDWAQGPVQVCWDGRDIAGQKLKVELDRVVVKHTLLFSPVLRPEALRIRFWSSDDL